MNYNQLKGVHIALTNVARLHFAMKQIYIAPLDRVLLQTAPIRYKGYILHQIILLGHYPSYAI